MHRPIIHTFINCQMWSPPYIGAHVLSIDVKKRFLRFFILATFFTFFNVYLFFLECFLHLWSYLNPTVVSEKMEGWVYLSCQCLPLLKLSHVRDNSSAQLSATGWRHWTATKINKYHVTAATYDAIVHALCLKKIPDVSSYHNMYCLKWLCNISLVRLFSDCEPFNGKSNSHLMASCVRNIRTKLY